MEWTQRVARNSYLYRDDQDALTKVDDYTPRQLPIPELPTTLIVTNAYTKPDCYLVSYTVQVMLNITMTH